MLSPTTPKTSTYIHVMNAIGWSLVAFLGLFTGFSTFDELFLSGLLTGKGGKALYGLLSAACYMAPFLLSGLIFRRINRHAVSRPISYSIKLPGVFPLLIIAGLGIILAAAYLNSWLCSLIGYEIPPELFAPTGYDKASTVIQYMTVGLAPAFAEEYLFRGVIYGNLRPFGKGQAILISAALFALMHQNISQLLYTFVGGLVMALMYEWTGSIWCGIIYHLLNNELSILTEYLYYGKLGGSIEYILFLWDMVVMLLGLICVMILLVYYRKRIFHRRDHTRNHGQTSTKSPIVRGSIEPMASDRAVNGSTICHGLRSPGLLVFGILSMISMVVTYLMIMFVAPEVL